MHKITAFLFDLTVLVKGEEMHSKQEEQQQDLQELDGLAQIQAGIKADMRVGMTETLDIRCVEAQKGEVKFVGVPDERFYNPRGITHGGYAATLLDCACGSAVYSCLQGNQGCTTAELKISYHKPILRETGPVYAVGKVLSLGRRLAFATAEVRGVNDGRLYASASSTLMILNQND